MKSGTQRVCSWKLALPGGLWPNWVNLSFGLITQHNSGNKDNPEGPSRVGYIWKNFSPSINLETQGFHPQWRTEQEKHTLSQTSITENVLVSSLKHKIRVENN